MDYNIFAKIPSSFSFFVVCVWSQGATIVDQIVSITPVENYVPRHETQVSPSTSFFYPFSLMWLEV